MEKKSRVRAVECHSLDRTRVESSGVSARARTAHDSRQFRRGAKQQRGWCFQAAQSARGAALAEGAFVPAPIVRAVSCYETRRASEQESQRKERKSKERRRKERKGLGREWRKERDARGKQRLSSQPGGGQTGRLRSSPSFSRAFIFPSFSLLHRLSFSCCFPSRAGPRHVESKPPMYAWPKPLAVGLASGPLFFSSLRSRYLSPSLFLFPQRLGASEGPLSCRGLT